MFKIVSWIVGIILFLAFPQVFTAGLLFFGIAFLASYFVQAILIASGFLAVGSQFACCSAWSKYKETKKRQHQEEKEEKRLLIEDFENGVNGSFKDLDGFLSSLESLVQSMNNDSSLAICYQLKKGIDTLKRDMTDYKSHLIKNTTAYLNESDLKMDSYDEDLGILYTRAEKIEEMALEFLNSTKIETQQNDENKEAQWK